MTRLQKYKSYGYYESHKNILTLNRPSNSYYELNGSVSKKFGFGTNEEMGYELAGGNAIG